MPGDRSERDAGTGSAGKSSAVAVAAGHHGHGAKKKLNKLYRSRSNTDTEIQLHQPRQFEQDCGPLPDPLRNRLYDLFGAIEREFEVLYADNLALHANIEALTTKLTECGNLPPEKAAELLEFETNLSAKVSTKKSSQVGQKIKTAFRVPPGRLVSSFKAGVGVGGSNASRVRYIRNFTGHRDGIWDVDVSQTTRPVLASASADHTACIWCLETGAILAQYAGHGGSVNSVKFNPNNSSSLSDGLCVLTASGDNTAAIWKVNVSLPSSQLPPVICSDDELEPIPADKEDGLNNEDSADHFPVVKTPLLQLTGHTNVVIAADWIVGGMQVITASWDRTAKIYDAERGEILHVLSGHDHELTHASAHSSQRLVVTSSKDSTFRLWDFREPIHSVSVFQGHAESVTSAVFSNTDKVVSGSDDKTVKIWDLKNMRAALSTIRLDSPVNRLAISAGHNMVAIPHDNRYVRLYDLQGSRFARLPRSNRRCHRRMVCAAAWNDDGQYCNLVTAGFDKLILGWKVNFGL